MLTARHRIRFKSFADSSSHGRVAGSRVIYSDDHGSNWSKPVDVTGGRKGDKDILLVDQNNNVTVAYENGGKQYISVSTNGGVSFSAKQVNIAPSGVALATGGVLDTKGNRYIAWSGTNNTGNGPTTFYVQQSSNLFATYSVTTVDEGQGEPQVSGAGWDYWGGSMQIAIQPKTAPANDRVIVVYNAGATSAGPERIYTNYSDTLGASWNIPYNATSWPNGTQLSLAPAGVWHGFPSIAGSASVVKVVWMDDRASAGGNYTCTSDSIMGSCGTWNVYMRSSADGATNWSAESVMSQATPYKDYSSAAGFDHPYGDYSEMVIDGTGNFYGIWAEGGSRRRGEHGLRIDIGRVLPGQSTNWVADDSAPGVGIAELVKQCAGKRLGSVKGEVAAGSVAAGSGDSGQVLAGKQACGLLRGDRVVGIAAKQTFLAVIVY